MQINVLQHFKLFYRTAIILLIHHKGNGKTYIFAVVIVELLGKANRIHNCYNNMFIRIFVIGCCLEYDENWY